MDSCCRQQRAPAIETVRKRRFPVRFIEFGKRDAACAPTSRTPGAAPAPRKYLTRSRASRAAARGAGFGPIFRKRAHFRGLFRDLGRIAARFSTFGELFLARRPRVPNGSDKNFGVKLTWFSLSVVIGFNDSWVHIFKEGSPLESWLLVRAGGESPCHPTAETVRDRLSCFGNLVGTSHLRLDGKWKCCGNALHVQNGHHTAHQRHHAE